MLKLFASPPRQVGYLVRDIEESLAYWSGTIGIGPWFYAPEVTLSEFSYRGKPGPVRLAVALANAGPIQMELLMTVGEGASLLHDATREGRFGINHVAYWTPDFDEHVDAAASQGMAVVQTGTFSGGRNCFIENAALDLAVEVVELTPPKARLYDAVAAAAVGWDGKNPIRPFSDLIV